MTRPSPRVTSSSRAKAARITSYNVCYTKLLRELIFVRRVAANESPVQHDILAWSSAPIGVVKLAERHGGRALRAASYSAMNAELADTFAAMKAELAPAMFDSKRYHLLGTSGTLTTLAGIKRNNFV